MVSRRGSSPVRSQLVAMALRQADAHLTGLQCRPEPDAVRAVLRSVGVDHRDRFQVAVREQYEAHQAEGKCRHERSFNLPRPQPAVGYGASVTVLSGSTPAGRRFGSSHL